MVVLESLSFSALEETIERYPWFAAARTVLCRRILEESGTEPAESIYRDFLPYLPAGERLSLEIYNTGKAPHTADRSTSAATPAPEESEARETPVIYDGTDFFSRGEYDSVRREEECSLGRLAKVDATLADMAVIPHDEDFDLVSETLAEIYADQGYSDRAIEIYNSLSLQSPEKSAYFASLIGKLKS